MRARAVIANREVPKNSLEVVPFAPATRMSLAIRSAIAGQHRHSRAAHSQTAVPNLDHHDGGIVLECREQLISRCGWIGLQLDGRIARRADIHAVERGCHLLRINEKCRCGQGIRWRIRDGMNRDFVADRLNCQIEYYLADRAEHLDLVQAWLLACDRRLH